MNTALLANRAARIHQCLVASQAFLYLCGAALIGLVGFLDWITGPEIAFSFFYLIPVSLFAWYRGHSAGLAAGVVCSALWLVVERFSGSTPSHSWVPYWNASIRMGIFLFAAWLAAEIASRTSLLQREIAERHAAEVELKRLNESLEARVNERTLALQQQANALRESEAALRQSTSLLRSILDSMGDGLVVADHTGRILLCNPAASRLLQIEPRNFELPPAHSPAGAGVSFLDLLRKLAGYDHPVFASLLDRSLDAVEIFLAHAARERGVWIGMTTRPMQDDVLPERRCVIVLRDITQRKLLENQVAEVSEREQRRIGQDLHDGVCQQLVSTAFAAELLRQKLAHQDSALSSDAEEIVEGIDQAITQSRSLARGLYPVSLEEEGLGAALEELAKAVAHQSGVRCEYSEVGGADSIEPTAASHLYRIAQEAVANALKHGAPKMISLELEQEAGQVVLRVTNDGIPFSRRSESRGMGLHMMQYRARTIGGVLSILPRPGGGTIVQCSRQQLNLS